MAPEVMRKEAITPKVDVYSFGIILWELVTRAEAFSNHDNYDVFQHAVCVLGERPPIPSDCPPLLRTLMQECWDADPANRPCFSEICGRMDTVIEECIMIEFERAIDEQVHEPAANAFWKTHFLSKVQPTTTALLLATIAVPLVDG
jgi:serine/threonine protein kinase